MNINDLYRDARAGGKKEEDTLFINLSEIFSAFVRQRIWDERECQEIVQDTMLAIAEKYRTTDFNISFSAWAYRILEYKILNYYRSKKIRESKFAQIRESQSSQAPESVNPVLEIKLVKCLRKIHRKNKKHARVLNLRFQGYEIEEICRKLNMTPNSIYVYLSRAREMLKQCLYGEK